MEPRKEFQQCFVRLTVISENALLSSHSIIKLNAQKSQNNLQIYTKHCYPCRYCSKVFTWGSARNLHEKRHLGITSHKCNYCGKSFSTRCYLKTHERVHTNMQRFECLFCRKRFLDNYSLYAHLRSHIGEKPHECQICGRGFANPCTRRRHEQSHTGSLLVRYTCSYCHKNFKNKGQYQAHLRVHSNEKPYTCKICPDKFYKHWTGLRFHMQTIHQSDKPFQCSFCPKMFSMKQQLFAHIRHAHTEEKHCKCDICGEAFKYPSMRLRHKLKVHQGDAKPYQCPKCSKRFRDQSGLKKHNNAVHLKLRPYACVFCDTAFAYKEPLNIHIRAHIQERHWKCAECGKGFFCKRDMERHALRHVDLKRYECLFCGGMWKLKISHDMHVRKHLGEMSEFCRKCGYEAPSTENRERHLINVHGQEKRRECPLCGKKFLNGGAVQQHLKGFHGKK